MRAVAAPPAADAEGDDLSGVGVCTPVVGDSLVCVVEGRGVVAEAGADDMILLLLLLPPRPGTATTLGASGTDMAVLTVAAIGVLNSIPAVGFHFGVRDFRLFFQCFSIARPRILGRTLRFSSTDATEADHRQIGSCPGQQTRGDESRVE